MKKINLPESISSYLRNRTLIGTDIISVLPISGSDTNFAFQVKTVTGSFFIKVNDVNKLDTFKKEAHSLRTLSIHSNFRIPKVLLFDKVDHYSFLALEFIEENRTDKTSHSLSGKYLADLHNIYPLLVHVNLFKGVRRAYKVDN